MLGLIGIVLLAALLILGFAALLYARRSDRD
jgi:hypothetical protein